MTKFEKAIEKIIQKPYMRRLSPDEQGGFTATILEFPGCIASGDTPTEALEELEMAARSWITVAIANGYSIREPIDFDGYSGKIALRVPRTLHRQAAEYAELEGVSINQFLVNAIAHYTGQINGINRIIEKHPKPFLVNQNVYFLNYNIQHTPRIEKTITTDGGLIYGSDYFHKLEKYASTQDRLEQINA